MPVTARTLLLIAPLCASFLTHASTVQRCEDAQGHITFTSLGCPNDHRMQLQDAYNAPPGSQINLLPESRPSLRPIAAPTQRDKTLVVIGQRDDGCGNQMSSEQRRRAIINKQIVIGMSMSDVESSLGKPDKIDQRTGETRYHYAPKKGGNNPKGGTSAQVTFDENGCVRKGKR